MFKRINSKAFFFTFAVILFASTLVFLTQSFSTKNVFDERYVISSYRSTIIPFVNDDISEDLKSILGFQTSIDYNGANLELIISDSISKEGSIENELNNYSLFLTEIYFKRNQGNKTIDFSNALDGGYEILYGTNFTYLNDFDNNLVKFSPNENRDLQNIDLNIYLGNKSLINYIWNPIELEGGTQVVINYFGDYNNFQINAVIDTTESSSLALEFEEGLVDINFGLIEGKGSSILIDSGINSKIDFSIYSNYSFDKNELPIYFNSNLGILLPDVEYSSLINLKR